MSTEVTFPLPPSEVFGFSRLRVIHSIPDTKNDVDSLPEAKAGIGKVTIDPLNKQKKINDPVPAIVINEKTVVYLSSVEDANLWNASHATDPDFMMMYPGEVIDTEGRPGFWAVAGRYRLTFSLESGQLDPIDTTIGPDHTLQSPNWLSTDAPDKPGQGQTFTTLKVPTGFRDGNYLGFENGRLVWEDGPSEAASSASASALSALASAGAANTDRVATEAARDVALARVDVLEAPAKAVLDDIMGGDVAGLAATVESIGVNILSFGATGGGVDDSTAIRATIAAAVTFGAPAYIPPGDWIISKAPGQFYCLDLPAGTKLTGPGVLRMADSQGASVRGLRVAGDNVTISGVTIDMNRTNQPPGEQQHGIISTAKNLQIIGVNIHDCKGDAILFDAGSGQSVIANSRMWNISRNGVTFYGDEAGATVGSDYTITGCHIEAVVGAIDAEPNNGHVDNVRVVANRLESTGASYAVSCAAALGELNRNWKLMGNTIIGAVYCTGLAASEIIGNTVDARTSPTLSPISALYNTDGITLEGNTIYGGVNKRCVNVQLSGVLRPTDWKIANNSIHVIGSTAEAIRVAGSGPVTITGNTIRGDGCVYGIAMQATADMDSVIMSNNTLDGFKTAIYMATYLAFKIKKLTITGNVIDNTQAVAGTAYGVQLAGTAAQYVQAVVSGNIVDSSYSIPEELGSVVVRLSGNHRVGVFSCSGTPEAAVTARPGATCLRRDGSTGTSFYVKETGTAATGWVAK